MVSLYQQHRQEEATHSYAWGWRQLNTSSANHIAISAKPTPNSANNKRNSTEFNAKPELNSVHTYLMLLLLLCILPPPFLLLTVLTHVSISPHLPSHTPSYLFFFLSLPYFTSPPPLSFWLLLLVVLILVLPSVPFLLCTRADDDQWIVSITEKFIRLRVSAIARQRNTITCGIEQILTRNHSAIALYRTDSSMGTYHRHS